MDMFKNITIKFALRYILVSLSALFVLISFPHSVFASRTINSVTLNGSSSVTVAPSTSISASIDVTTTETGTNTRWRSTSWQVGAGAVTCVDHPNHDVNGTFNEVFTITAPASNGTYDVNFIAYRDDACSLNASATFTLTGGIIVSAPTNTPTPTPTNTPTPTATPTPTNTPTPTPTNTPTPTPTNTPTPTPTPVGTRTITNTTLNGTSVVTVIPSSSISSSIDVATTGSGASANWNSTSWQVGAGTITCVDHPNHATAGSYTETFTITAPASNGTYDVHYIAFSDDGCSVGSSSTFTLTDGIIVISPTSTPTPIPTNTPTPTPTNTPTPVPTDTPTPTPTNTPTPTPVPPTSTPTPTQTPTPVPTSTPTPIPPTNTPTPINTPTPTETPIPPTNTPTPIDTPIPTATTAPTSTPTPTPAQFCGNGICESSISETCSVCSLDCGACPTSTPAPTETPPPVATDTPVPGVTEASTPGPTNTSAPEATSTSAPGPSSTSAPAPTATPTPTPFINPTVRVNQIDPAPQVGAKVTINGNFTSGTLAVARIEVTFDNGLTWFLAQISGNNFSVIQENLEDGNYPVRARAIDVSGESGQSNTQILLIDNLPPIIGGSAFSFGPQILSSDSEGFIRVSAETQITTALSTRGGVTKAEIKSDGETFPLNIIPGTNILTGNLIFNNPGVKDLIIIAEDGVGKKTERSVGTLLVEPVGKVTGQDEKQIIKNAVVSIYFFDKNSQTWVLWDGVSYGQTNPKKVEDNGNYSFMVPAGRYFIQTDAPGRRRAQSNIFDFTSTSILNANFKTTPSLNILSNILPPDTLNILNKQAEKKLPNNILGNSAPNFKLPSISGLVTPDSFKGKKTVFTFISTWAPESVIQTQILQKLNPKLSQDQKILGIALQETQSTTETFLKRGGYNFSVISDLDGYTAEDYKVGTLPYHVFIDTKGKIREISSGLLTESEIIQKLNKLQ